MLEDVILSAVFALSVVAGMYVGDWHMDGGSLDDFLRLDIQYRAMWILRDMAGLK